MIYGKAIPTLGTRKHSAYGFVNERAVRIGAGILFTIGFFTFLSVLYAGKYTMAMFVVGAFWTDFLLKVIQPRYSLISRLATYLARHGEPEWVGAIQKRFAWSIGLGLSSIVFFMLIRRYLMTGGVDPLHAPDAGYFFSWPMVLCIICLVFMRCEAIVGWCAGCTIYSYLLKHRILKNTDHQTCPDGACSL